MSRNQLNPFRDAMKPFCQYNQAYHVEDLFDHLLDVVYFVKNKLAQYEVVNSTFVQRCGKKGKAEIIGRTASEVFAPPFGDNYHQQDLEVLRTGQPIYSNLELHFYPSGEIGWCLSTKLPLLDSDGDVIGLSGCSQDLRLPNYKSKEYEFVARAIEYAEKNISKPVTIKDMTKIAKMSRYQLDRRIKTIFGVTTGQWILKGKIDRARLLLANTDQPIAMIALESGYSDQSAFTRQFRRFTGVSPNQYRANRS